MTRVLVVEDDPQLVRALVINLQARQHGVDAAPDGATALRLGPGGRQQPAAARLAALARPEAHLMTGGQPGPAGTLAVVNRPGQRAL
ncbi:hypothetical protein GCM10010448_45840 [Streptomyces glomeratus]|uniref:Response regulatory domain-containing protein n=1 Tax=Streptomyces glomeratus TaxID=284452 RepID=A0ABP6LTG6_9ACTN